MQAFIPRQAAPISSPICLEGVQTFFPRRTGVSVPAKAPLVLWGDDTSSLDNTTGITKEQGQRPRGQAPQLPQLGQAKSMPSRGSTTSQRENTLEDPSHKWVINLSNKPLTQAQRSLHAKGPSYVIAPGNLLT